MPPFPNKGNKWGILAYLMFLMPQESADHKNLKVWFSNAEDLLNKLPDGVTVGHQYDMITLSTSPHEVVPKPLRVVTKLLITPHGTGHVQLVATTSIGNETSVNLEFGLYVPIHVPIADDGDDQRDSEHELSVTAPKSEENGSDDEGESEDGGRTLASVGGGSVELPVQPPRRRKRSFGSASIQSNGGKKASGEDGSGVVVPDDDGGPSQSDSSDGSGPAKRRRLSNSSNSSNITVSSLFEPSE